MVLVNNPGTWSAHLLAAGTRRVAWLDADRSLFPFFLFIVGVAIPLAFGRRIESGGSKRDLYLKVVKRTLIIFALGNVSGRAFPYFHLSTIRIPACCNALRSVISSPRSFF